MSIIYDALKKVEASVINEPKTKTDKRVKPKIKPYLLYALLACVGLFIANAFSVFSFPKPSLNKTQAAVKPEPIIQPPARTSALEVIPQELKPPSFNLTGVFFSKDESYALINNQIVKKGDKIDGATVMEITVDEVVLESKGSTIKLSGNASNNPK